MSTYTVTACAPGTPGPTRITVRRPHDYWYRGAETEPFPGEPTPRQIVAQLHKQIAAKSPQHARLVAAFHALERERAEREKKAGHRKRPCAASDARRERLEEFAALMESGLPVKAAARQMGVNARTARGYALEIRREADGD